MRVRIAANLPPDLRGIVDADDAFVRDRRVLPVLPRPAARARSGLARLGWAGRAGAAGVFDYFLDVTVGCRQSV